jgi:rhamnosyltransferase
MNSDVSIIILMKNEERFIGETLRSIYAQRTARPFEVIAIDSGSRDRTVDVARGFEGVHVVQIEPQAFGHGKTRNYGASLARGCLLVFNNADATPVDENWLEELLKPFAMDEKVAGTYSTHRPRPDCTPIKGKEIELNEVFVTGKDRWASLQRIPNFRELPLYRQKDLYNFTTISCAMRKEIHEKYPFKEIKFGEDLEWGRTIIEAGSTIVACCGSQIYHSHNFTLLNYFRTNFDDSNFVTSIGLNYFAGKRRRILSFLYHSVGSDFGYIRRLGKPLPYRAKWLLLSLFYRLAAAAGLCLGTYAESLPPWIVSRISLVDRIKAA